MEQIIANGLYLGAQYALIALGLTLIFSLMNVLNFAHGQMYVFGGFVTYTVVVQLGLPFIVGLFASAVVLAVMGAAIEKFLFAPVVRRSKRDESTMLLAAGVAFFLRRTSRTLCCRRKLSLTCSPANSRSMSRFWYTVRLGCAAGDVR